jgi:hypothetical protein
MTDPESSAVLGLYQRPLIESLNAWISIWWPQYPGACLIDGADFGQLLHTVLIRNDWLSVRQKYTIKKSRPNDRLTIIFVFWIWRLMFRWDVDFCMQTVS